MTITEMRAGRRAQPTSLRDVRPGQTVHVPHQNRWREVESVGVMGGASVLFFAYEPNDTARSYMTDHHAPAVTAL